MSTNTDAMLGRMQAELDDRQTFIDGVVEAAQKEARDLSTQEMELVTRARERIGEVTAQITPLQEAIRIAADSRAASARIAAHLRPDAGPAPQIEYRSAGAYICERWSALLGNEQAAERLELWTRAAAHQLTGDNPSIIPEPVVGGLINFVDGARPLVSAFGPQALPGASFYRPTVTQQPAVAEQITEKTELASQKMIMGQIAVSSKTFGGYLNVSRQNVDFSQPQIMDIVINGLATQYAIQTEAEAASDFLGAATAGPTLPTGAADPDAVAGAIWGAAAMVLAATAGQGRLMAFAPPQMIGLIGPLFPPVNPQNAQSTGFTTASLGTGAIGSVAGVPIYNTPALPDNNILVASSAAAEVYEQRVGALQVVEPSVLGIQVGYAGYFADVVLENAGLVKIVKTP